MSRQSVPASRHDRARRAPSLPLAFASGRPSQARGAAEARAGQHPRGRRSRSPISRPMLVARDKGYFADENLNVTWSPVAQGAVAVEAVFGGSAEIGGSVDLRADGRARQRPRHHVRRRRHPHPQRVRRTIRRLLVRTDDSIKTAGRPRRQENLRRADQQRQLRPHAGMAAARTASIRNKIEFLELPFPQMADALFQNRLDAVWNVEPFVTFMLQVGQGAGDRLSRTRTTCRAWTSPTTSPRRAG